MSGYRSGAAQKMLVTKPNTAGQTNIGPDVTTSVNLTTVAGDYSSWVQYVASLTDTRLLTWVSVKAPAGLSVADFPVVFQVAVGGAGSENSLIDLPLQQYPFAAALCGLLVPTPVRVAPGSRVAVRVFVNSTAGIVFSVQVFGVPYVNVEGN